MKNSIKALLLGLIIMPCMFVFSGCNLFGGSEDVDLIVSHNFTNLDTSYETGDSFSVNGFNLVLTYSETGAKTITLTDNMIKSLPDMNSAGQKTIVITYGGVDYSFIINVVDKQAEYLAKVQEFLTNYQTSNSTASLNVNMNYDLLATLLGDDSVIANQENLIGIDLEDVSEYGLSADIYKAVINSLVNSSLTIGSEDIIDIDTLQSKFDYLMMLVELQTSLSEIEYYNRAMEIIFPDGTSSYTYEITDFICEMAYIDIPSIGYWRICSIVNIEFFQKILACEEIDFAGIVSDINKVIQDYSTAPIEFKTQINSLVTSALSENPQHVLSNLFLNMKQYVYLCDPNTGYRIEHEDETSEMIELKTNYMTSFANVFLAIENIYTTDINTALFNIKTAAQNFLDASELVNDNGYEIGGDDGVKQFVYIVNNFSTLAYDALTLTFTELDEKYTVVGTATMTLTDLLIELKGMSIYVEGDPANGFTQEFMDLNDLIYSYVYSLINNEPVNHYQFIEDFCLMYGNANVSEYTSNYELYGTPYIFTSLCEDYIASWPEEFTVAYGTELLNEFSSNLLTFAQTVDEIPVNGIGNILPTLHSLSETLYKIAVYDEIYVNEFNILTILTEPNSSFSNNVSNLITEYEAQISYVLAQSICYMYGIENDGAEFGEVYTYAYDFVDSILNGEFNAENAVIEFIQALSTYENQYNGQPSGQQITTYAVGLMALVLSGADVDYNEILSDIELPPAIASIDYNLLIEKLTTGETYDAFTINDVIVQTVLDENGNIVSETLTLTLDIDFNIMVSSVSGAVTLTFEIVY